MNRIKSGRKKKSLRIAAVLTAMALCAGMWGQSGLVSHASNSLGSQTGQETGGDAQEEAPAESTDGGEDVESQIVDENTPIRRVSLTYNHVNRDRYCQYDFFTSPDQMEKERQMQRAVLDIKRRFGKNAVLKGMDFQEGATTIERNGQIGGHRSGA